MLTSVAGFSLIPLFIALGGAADSPFLFSAALQLGQCFATIAFLTVLFRDILFNASVQSIILPRILSWSLLFIILSKSVYAPFAIGIRFVDISVATILFETWPIVLILMTAALFRGESRYRKLTPAVLLLLALGFVGFSFVAASETGGFGNWGNAELLNTIIGIVFVLLAALTISLSAFGFRWGVDLRQALPEKLLKGKNIALVDVCCVLVASFIADFAGAVLASTIGLASGETLNFRALAIALLGGGSALALATISWRTANLMTSNLGINALAYATPIFSLMWLFLLWQVNIARVDYLLIGAAAIISANLLINFEADIRFGFKALILALWACGAFVYLRDDFLHLLPFEGWLWPPETYLGALGLSATVFILLLTFRVARLAPRTQDEDNRLFALHRNLELLARRNLIDPNVNQHIRGIDSAHNPRELRIAYTGAKLCFAQAADADHPPADRKLLADAETQLNIIVHSRQQGVDFGELFSLIIFGGSTVLLALLSRPAVEGWTVFLYEVFSVLFSAVIVFLIINVWDLHRERADLVLANQENSREYGVIFRDPKNRRFEQSVSVVIGLLIILAYGGLLWYKWLG